MTDQEITLYTERADGTGGFPGNLKIWVTYGLTEAGELEISYRVETDQDTLVNPTNHSYFNLSGNFTQPINDHVFQINHQGFTPFIQMAFLFTLWIEKVQLFSISTKPCC